jgi:hypothetical protein
MKQSTDIRVKTDAKYDQLYKDLRPYCGEAHSVFFLCACLGVNAGRRADGTGRRSDRFWSATITADEWACYYAIAVEERNMDFTVLDDDKSVIQLAESYADGGMEVLIEELLDRFLAKGDTPKLDTSSCSDLSWQLLKFIPDRLV